MQDEKNLCYRCRYFDRYYTKAVKAFQKTKLGWCCKKMHNVESQSGCENYLFRKPHKNRGLIEYHLSDLLAEVSSLRQIMEENYDVTNGNEDV